jgi:hypothetical protein
MSRRALVIKLAPAAPACFADRLAWVEYLVSAAEEQRPGHRGPLDLRKSGEEPTFNHSFNFCAMCSATYALKMQAQDRCHPWHLRELRDAPKPVEAPDA